MQDTMLSHEYVGIHKKIVPHIIPNREIAMWTYGLKSNITFCDSWGMSCRDNAGGSDGHSVMEEEESNNISGG